MSADGFTKRERMAAMAMQGLCASSIPGSHHGFKQLASEAVSYADALLDALAVADPDFRNKLGNDLWPDSPGGDDDK